MVLVPTDRNRTPRYAKRGPARFSETMRGVSRSGLALLCAGLLGAACTSGGTASKGTTTSPPAVVTDATPAGWIPVDFGDAQLSVPADWHVAYDAGCVPPAPPGVLYVGSSGYDHCPAFAAAVSPVVLLEPLPVQSSSPATAAPSRMINGIDVRGQMEHDGYGIYAVPSLGVDVIVRGRQGLPVLATLTRSPATVALARGPAPMVPGSWTRIIGGDVSFAVPASWTTMNGSIDGENCGFDPSLYPPDNVLIEPGGAAPAACGIAPPLPPPIPPADGVIVNLQPRPTFELSTVPILSRAATIRCTPTIEHCARR